MYFNIKFFIGYFDVTKHFQVSFTFFPVQHWNLLTGVDKGVLNAVTMELQSLQQFYSVRSLTHLSSVQLPFVDLSVFILATVC